MTIARLNGMSAEGAAAIYGRAFANSRPWSAAEIADMTTDPGFLLACPTGIVIGRVTFEDAELITIAVDPADQGQGTGRALLDAFEAEASARGAHRAILEVAEDNVRATALYDSRGWCKIGRRRGYYARNDGSRQDALIYEKQILNT